MHNGISERVFRFSKDLKRTNEIAFTHSSVMFEFPEDEPLKRSPSSKPLFSHGLNLLVVGNENATLSCGVLEEHIIGGFLGEDVDTSLNIPAPSTQTIY